jgi:hypothetical protein
MLHRTLAVLLSAVAILAGCATPGASSVASAPMAASLTLAGDLTGTWVGSFGQVGADQYEDEASSILQIREDGTFTATFTRSGGTNNLAQRSTLSGTVVTRGNRVTLQNSEGAWSSITLVHSGNTLYGVATDPAPEANVMMNFRRASPQSSRPGGSGPQVRGR